MLGFAAHFYSYTYVTRAELADAYVSGVEMREDCQRVKFERRRSVITLHVRHRVPADCWDTPTAVDELALSVPQTSNSNWQKVTFEADEN